MPTIRIETESTRKTKKDANVDISTGTAGVITSMVLQGIILLTHMELEKLNLAVAPLFVGTAILWVGIVKLLKAGREEQIDLSNSEFQAVLKTLDGK